LESSGHASCIPADLNSFPKWRDMLARFERQLSECTPDRCRLDEWQQLVASLHVAPRWRS
jgi:hypothetical protein